MELESGGLLGAGECKEDQKGHWGKAEPEYNEWIYENGKFTEISAASLATGVSMRGRHVFLRG